MIKLNELRLGNYVQPDKDHLNQFHGVGLVTLIQEEKFTVSNHYPGKWFEPISITEEWLVKFGFKQDQDCVLGLYPIKYFDDLTAWRTKCHFAVSSFGDDPYYDLDVPNIKFVHQLQNLYYALTGNELQ
ncbi:MAG: hypothetical protein K0S44_199 [Bacteroidetes bacterium]|nr:hypothetical protein [Bacteroidota bacterium]